MRHVIGYDVGGRLILHGKGGDPISNLFGNHISMLAIIFAADEFREAIAGIGIATCMSSRRVIGMQDAIG